MRYFWLGAAHRVPFLVTLAAGVVLPGCNDEISAPTVTEPSLVLGTANPGSWALRAPMPVARYAVGSGVIPNAAGQDIMYVVGGTKINYPSYDNVMLKRMDAYNAATNTWTRRADLPEKRHEPAVEAIGGKLYVAGGIKPTSTSAQLTKTLYMYTPATNTWSRKTDMPIATRGMAAVISGQLYVLTRDTPQRLYRYNPGSDTWARRADLLRDHRRGAASVISGKLYAVWGNSPTVDRYDPATNQWTTRLTMQKADWEPYLGKVGFDGLNIISPNAVTLNQQLYLIGGTFADDESGEDAYLSDVFAYNPVSNGWSKKANMHEGRAESAVGKVRNRAGVLQIIATGGYEDADFEPFLTDVTEAFTP